MYRAFRSEAEDVAGAYDGRAITLDRASTTSREVAVHESIHERLFHETFDGILHRLLILRVDLDDDIEASGRSDLLMEETEFAHEAAATFLGVQSLDDADERAQVFCGFPPAYQIHYQVMAEVINPLTSSTYLAYCLGWSLAFWAFQSGRLVAIFRDGWDAFDEVLAREASPSIRMRAGVELLRGAGSVWLSTALDRATFTLTAEGVATWDVHDDDQWREQPQAALGWFEAHLSAELWRWLRQNGPYPSSKHDDLPDGFDTWLLEQLDVPTEQQRLVIKNDAYDADPENKPLLAVIGALRGGKARIKNSDTQRIERVRTRQPLDRNKALRRFLGHSPATYFIGSASPCGTKGWAVYVYKGDPVAVAAADGTMVVDRFIVVENFAIALIARVRDARVWQGSGRNLFMVAVDSQNLANRVEELDGLIRGLPSVGDGSVRRRGPDWPLWYWNDDWPNLLACPGAATSARRLQIAGTGKDETYVLHVARIDGLPGYLIKLAPPMSANAVLEYEVSLNAEGKLDAISDDETDSVCAHLSGYLSIILENWHSF